MAVRHPGDDDRATVDLGPRPDMVDGGDGPPPRPSDPGDLGPGDDTHAEGEHGGPTRTIAPDLVSIPAGVDPVHQLPTQQLPRKKSVTQSHATKYNTATSPAEAMRLEELARTQIFLRVAIVTGIGGFLIALLMDGDPIAFRVVMGGCAVTTLGALWMRLVVRDPATFEPRRAIAPALVIAVGALGGVYYWGVASPVAAMITYGIYFFSLGSNARITTAMYLVVAVLHGAMILLVAAGGIADRGIVSMQGVKTIDQLGVLVVVEFLYFITFYTARRSQRVTLEHVSALEQAVRGVAQREALLAEARAELDRALKVGGPGRFTDQVVGSFKLGVLIGRGGMGEVYEAQRVAASSAATPTPLTVDAVAIARKVASQAAMQVAAQVAAQAAEASGPGPDEPERAPVVEDATLPGRARAVVEDATQPGTRARAVEDATQPGTARAAVAEARSTTPGGGAASPGGPTIGSPFATEAAVKLLHPGTLSDPTHVARFVREAQTASRLDCPHVVKVLEVGTTAGEVPYLAMERLRGHDLAHQLRKQRRLELPQAAVLAEQVALGLDAARVAGIVHRDLKPHNVFFSHDGLWKILDFGVSKSGGSGTLTKGHVIGTPAYMAPEQARGEDVDHRADVYSLAAILYRSITGHPAFTGKDVPTTLYDVVYRVPTQPSMLASLPADVDRVLALGLAKDRKERFATAVELAAWFRAAITDELAPEQRRRANDLINKHPWGTRQPG